MAVSRRVLQRSGGGSGSLWFFKLAMYPAMASLMLVRASSRVFPWETQPGSVGHSATNTPSSSGSMTTRNFMPAISRSSRGKSTLPPGSFHLRLYPAQEHIGRDVERRAIIAPRTIGGGFARPDCAQVFAVRAENQHAARAGGPQVAASVHFHAVGQARVLRADHRRRIEENPAVGERAVGLHAVGHPDGHLRVAARDVEGLFVRRKRQTVGAGDLVGEQSYFAIGLYSIDALVGDFLLRIVHVFFQAVRRV